MKILNIKITDNNKFKDGFEISYLANMHRKANLDFVEDGVLKWNLIFGKNASGKSSVYRAIISYFNIFSKFEKKVSRQNNVSLFSTTQRFTNEDDFSSFLTGFGRQDKLSPSETKLSNLLKSQYEDSPRYEVTYVYKGRVYVHNVIAKADSVKGPMFKHKIYLQSSSKVILKTCRFSPNLRITSFDPDAKYSLSLSEDNNDFFASLKSYIDTTSKSMVLPTAEWTEEITSHLQELMSVGDHEAIKNLQEVAKWTDNNFQYFQDFPIAGMLPMAAIIVGEELKNVPISRLSTGTRRAIYTMFRIQTIINSPVGGLYIKDEFETYLHRDIVNYLLKYPLESKKFQGFATSHSPEIFDFEVRYDSISYLKNTNNVVTVQLFKENGATPRPDKKISSLYYKNPFTNPED